MLQYPSITKLFSFMAENNIPGRSNSLVMMRPIPGPVLNEAIKQTNLAVANQVVKQVKAKQAKPPATPIQPQEHEIPYFGKKVPNSKYIVVLEQQFHGIYFAASLVKMKRKQSGKSFNSYKFDTKEKAETFYLRNMYPEEYIQDFAVAYTDGSYDPSLKQFSYGALIDYKGQQYRVAGSGGKNNQFNQYCNVAGEAMGVKAAIDHCIANGIKEVVVNYDYEGIPQWYGSGTHQKSKLSKYMHRYFKSVQDKIEIRFNKVKAHSKIAGNEIADSLAKAGNKYVYL